MTHPEPSPSQRDETGVVVPRETVWPLGWADLARRIREAVKADQIGGRHVSDLLVWMIQSGWRAPLDGPTPPAPAGDAEAMREACATAAENVRLPDEYVWGEEARECFELGKQCAATAIRALAPQRAREGGEVEAIDFEDRAQQMAEEMRRRFGVQMRGEHQVAWLARCLIEVVANDDPERIRALTPTPTAREEPDIGGLDGGEDGEPEGDDHG